jgi:hypothetical protein
MYVCLKQLEHTPRAYIIDPAGPAAGRGTHQDGGGTSSQLAGTEITLFGTTPASWFRPKFPGARCTSSRSTTQRTTQVVYPGQKTGPSNRTQGRLLIRPHTRPFRASCSTALAVPELSSGTIHVRLRMLTSTGCVHVQRRPSAQRRARPVGGGHTPRRSCPGARSTSANKNNVPATSGTW